MTLGNILWFGILGVFAYMMIKNGGCCGGHDHGGHGDTHDTSNDQTGHDSSDSDHKHTMQLKNPVPGTGKDPVCGMDIQKNSLTSEHMGRTFHFCSEQCRKMFSLNPDRYVS